MDSILNDILRLIGDATNYLKMFVAGATGFFVLRRSSKSCFTS